jgi:hypothetical protein
VAQKIFRISPAASLILLVAPCLAEQIPYVAAPEFKDVDSHPFDGPVLMEGIWTSISAGAPYSFEIAPNKIRVLHPHCKWHRWEYLGGGQEFVGGVPGRMEATIHVLGKPSVTNCLGVPLYIYFVYTSPPSRSLAEVCLECRRENERVLVMTRHPLP